MATERWEPGARASFEYHCWESLESSDAELWLHSHQRVTLLEGPRWDAELIPPEGDGSTRSSRAEDGTPWTYLVRFDDGFEWTVFEDELSVVDRRAWYRPDPPRAKVTA